MLGKMETYWIYGHTINLIVLKVREIKYKKSYHEHIRLIKLDIKNWCLSGVIKYTTLVQDET
jgi:hypothetical protein